MENLWKLDPHGRFTGLAERYALFRPDYPRAALDFIMGHCQLAPGMSVVDVGCGTGIFSRLLAERGLNVLGLEPNADMRRQAEAHSTRTPLLRFRKGNAERTGLEHRCCDAVVAAQAFHWFDASSALAEFHRILRPGGWVVLIWNERDESDPFSAAYGVVIRSTREGPDMETARRAAGQPLLDCPIFENACRHDFEHAQILDEERMIGRALSVSYAPKEPAEIQRHVERLREEFTRFQRHGEVVLHYITSVFLARKPGAP